MQRARIQKSISIDLGDEPPLVLNEEDASRHKHGGVSLRWLASAAITGIAGVGLFTGALYSSVSGNVQAAKLSPAWEGQETQRSFAATTLGASGKSDKFIHSDRVEVQRSVIQSSAIRRIGDKEFVRIQPYVRLVAPLAVAGTELSADLPRFNPLKVYSDGGIFSDGSQETEKETAPSDQPDVAHIVATLTDYSVLGSDMDEATVLSDEDAQEFIKDFAPQLHGATIAAGQTITPNALVDPQSAAAFPQAAELENIDLWAGINVQLPNTSVFQPSSPTESGNAYEADASETFVVSGGDTLASILIASGSNFGEAQAITEALGGHFDPRNLQPGDEVRLAKKIAGRGNSGPARIDRISIFSGGDHKATVSKVAPNAFVHVANPDLAVAQTQAIAAVQAASGTERPTLYRSLYETGLRHEIPEAILSQMVRVHAFNVDFKRKVQPGDHIEIFYELPDEAGFNDVESDLPLMIAMTTRGETHRFYKFRTPDDGELDYYDPDGRSAKKFLIRKPMQGGKFRSGFGMRRHPILRYRRMHTGVDWSAPRGTPVYAAGDGTVVKAGRHGGYGNFIKIRHAYGYETAYGHLNSYARGVREGRQVTQGQLIGTVGSTGLSTGPHLHYEVRVNGNHVDPLRIRLPRGRTLQGDMLLAFEREKKRIDELMLQEPVVSASSTEAAGQGAFLTGATPGTSRFTAQSVN